jgi:hypothetical protein
MAFSSVYMLGFVVSGWYEVDTDAETDSQLLEITVRNVVVAPVRNGVELDAVGELHIVLLFKPPALLGPLDVVLALTLPCCVVVFVFDGRIVVEFD